MTTSTAAAAVPLLSLKGIRKSFPGVQAVKEGDFELKAGEVHALIGENGAGKSTLIKVLAGVHSPDAGFISINGYKHRISSPIDAAELGIGVIYQEFNLVPTLTVRENILLGKEKTRAGFTDKKIEKEKATEALKFIGVEINPEIPCTDLTVAEQQIVEIAKAVSADAGILIMDEPTAALTAREVEKLFNVVRILKKKGIGIIFITHRLSEVFDIADRVTVMRDGICVGSYETTKISRKRLVELMVGRKIEQEFPYEKTEIGEEILSVNGISRSGSVNDVSFSVRAGEVLGITGLVGSGRTETARLIFGADRRDSGEIYIDGALADIESPSNAIKYGVSLLTEDRKSQGLMLNLSAEKNFSIANLPDRAKCGFINKTEERRSFRSYIKSLKIKVSTEAQPVRTLSGGNQQKVLIARWLETNSKIMIFDEPTRGVDVGAKYEIYLLINRLKKNGKAIVIISSEFPEVLGMCDRVLVMHRGEITGEIKEPRKATQKIIMKMATDRRTAGK